MSLPFFHTGHLDISNYLDFPRELLNSTASNEKSILIIGPDLVRREASPQRYIETAYAQNWHSKFCTFYLSSIDQVVKASQKKQTFILNLYGDLDEIDSIKVGHRQLTGLYSEELREQLPD